MLKFLGGTLLLIGAVVGGGILAIPIISANFGFITTLIVIVCTWLLMTKTGLYILSLSLSCNTRHNTYYTIVGNFLGYKAQLLTVFLFLWLLYFSLSSYISGCISILAGQFKSLPISLLSFLFILIFGALVASGVKIIIRLSAFIVIGKLSLLLLTIITILSHPITEVALHSNSLLTSNSASLVMIILNSFGYHFIIPSLVNHYGKDKKNLLQGIIICSTSFVLVLYLAWLYTIYSIIPIHGSHGLLAIHDSQNQLLAFNQSLQFHLCSNYYVKLISIFESIALFSSLICVSLGVFDFLQDAFKTNNSWLIGLLTFLPPLSLTLISENMYIYEMTLAGYISIILEVIIPFLAKRAQSFRLTT